MDLPLVSDYTTLFTKDVPLLDVRAPIEFGEGAFPSAVNFPLLSDKEREQIGTTYKQLGHDNAVELGRKLVSGKVKDDRVSAWIEFAKNNPDGALYCFRGGMRSKVCQQWIYEESGIVFPRIEGGYKALRRYLINELENAPQNFNGLILSGRTGVGKTAVLDRIKEWLDLENIFHHRGSAFGKHAGDQPRQINIENTLAINLLKMRNRGITKFVMEDEAPSIGSRRIPDGLVHLLKHSPIIVLESSLDERIENIYQEYIVNSLAEYQDKLGTETGFKTWSSNLLASVKKIEKRLGGDRFQTIYSMMEDGIANLHSKKQTVLDRESIKYLLTHYYDPMYDYQLNRKKERIIFSGNVQSVVEFLNTSL